MRRRIVRLLLFVPVLMAGATLVQAGDRVLIKPDYYDRNAYDVRGPDGRRLGTVKPDFYDRDTFVFEENRFGQPDKRPARNKHGGDFSREKR